ncbi:hypothetical protein KUH03_23130 [Sphingobacterium sp. E70]|uniref:hypothetical protein n=1 Tax=Sphingobacterium sp. E70 TaxID=2853439 RepID=UPI00211B8E87|nr:hypothetical protein [Sphingobacterium sp. E70]ULT22334.1 hypothetical protein KUH03_23130 [Sphingobacterium sp. E70]
MQPRSQYEILNTIKMLKQYTLLATLLAGTSSIYAQSPLEGYLINKNREAIASGTLAIKIANQPPHRTLMDTLNSTPLLPQK